MDNRVVITAANSPYFDSLKTLVDGIHEHNFDLIDKIVVYDLGLTEYEINNLNNLQKVEIKKFEISPLPFEDYLKPKGHAYKLFCLWQEQNFAKNILWLDAGVMPLRSIKEIFDIIEKEDIFLVGDIHLNKNFTKKSCVDIMNASEKELEDNQLSSGILGYKAKGNYQKLIDEAYEYSKIEGCVVGDEENHRHDQSVYSILASRYNCKKYDIDIYGYWTNHERTLKTAIEKNAMIFVHRRGHNDHRHLKYKNE